MSETSNSRERGNAPSTLPPDVRERVVDILARMVLADLKLEANEESQSSAGANEPKPAA